MEQEERLNYLIEYLLQDSDEYKNMKVQRSERTRILRSLMNVRMPKAVEKQFLKIQDDYLKEEVRRRGTIGLKEIPTISEQYGSKHSYAQKLSIWQGDITRLEIDAIVNAANSQMLGCFVPCHRCIDNAIHSAAGIELREACYHLMQHRKAQFGPSYEAPTGQAEITSGYNLPAQYVIHTVGPIVEWKLTDQLRQDLKVCYRNVLECAMEHSIRSIAFCCISTGEFHFPNDEAAEIAVNTVMEVLDGHSQLFDRIIFNVFKDEDLEIYKNILIE